MASDKLKIVIQLDAKGNLSKSVKDVDGQLHNLATTTSTAAAGSSRLEKSLAKLSKYGHAAAFGFLANLTMGRFLDEVGQFETAVKRLAATSGASADQIAQLQAQARELGATSIYSAQQAADAFSAMEGQWNQSVGMNGMVTFGLNYAVIDTVAAKVLDTEPDHKDLFIKLQVMEREALEILNKR